jgi:hypothetical protein
MAYIEGTFGTPLAMVGVPGAGTDCVQTLTIGGTPTAGPTSLFRVAFNGLISLAAGVLWSATNATLLASLQASLDAMPNVGTNGIVATAGTLTAGVGTILLTFSGANLAKKVQIVMTVPVNNMTGTAPTAVIAISTPGVNAAFRGAAIGALAVDQTTTTGKIYQNTGTAQLPTWTAQT